MPSAKNNERMDKIRSAFRQLEARVSQLYKTQERANNRACQLLLWREIERQVNACVESHPSSPSLSAIDQYVSETVCRLAEDAVWMELGNPTRTVLVWTDGSAYLHENTPAVLQDIFEAGKGPIGQWVDGHSMFTEEQKIMLEGIVRKHVAELY